MAKYVSSYRSQTRSKTIRYIATLSVTILLLAVLQVSVLGKYRPLGVVPDLMLCTVLCIAFLCGRYAGAITGIGAGFLIEAMGSVGISFLPLAYLIVGYVVGNYARAQGQRVWTTYLLYLGAGMLARGAITLVYILLQYESMDFLQIFLHILLPEIVLTFLFGALLYAPMRLLVMLLERKK